MSTYQAPPAPFTKSETCAYLSAMGLLERLREEKKEWRGPCVDPDHEGDRSGDSMSMSPGGVYKCHSHECKGNLYTLHRKLSGLEQAASDRDLFEIVGRAAPKKSWTERFVCAYDYCDEQGVSRYQVVRMKDPKNFPQRRPDPAAKRGFAYDLNGVNPLPYHLPELLRSDPAAPVYVCEGEKDVLALEALGFVATTNSGGAGNWQQEINSRFVGRNVIILPDYDVAGRDHADDVVRHLLPVARSVKIVALPDLPEKGDASDWIAAGGTAEELRRLTEDAAALTVAPTSREIAAQSSDVWLANRNGIRPVLANAITALKSWPLGYDAFKAKPVFLKDCPDADAKAGDAVDDHHVRWIANCLQHRQIFVSVDTAGQAVYAVAQLSSNHFHPVRDYLRGLKWDGVERLESWLATYAHTDDSPYERAVGRSWMISAVARIMKPGCKVDTVLIMESPEQGRLKSTLIEKLVGVDAWFTNRLPPIGDKDSLVQLQGKWIIEIAELSGLKGRGSQASKEFFSARIDTYRPPYGRTPADFPRQVVFFGTTNEFEYLDDPSGARRFWPVTVRSNIDPEKITADRDQLWAEAVHLFDVGTPWHLSPELEKLAGEEQADRFLEDAWASKIEDWVRSPRLASGEMPKPENCVSCEAEQKLYSVPGRVLTTEVLMHALGIEPRHTKGGGETQRVAKVLRHLGYVRLKKEFYGVSNEKRGHFYVSPDWKRPPEQMEVPFTNYEEIKK